MIPYWVLFSIPAFASLFERRGRVLGHRGEHAIFFLAITLICFLVGLRYRVGGDWGSYIQYLIRASYTKFDEIPSEGDPGYILLNWLAAQIGADVWLVNMICGVLFAWGLFSFALAQPRPWLALTVAVPYLVVVVAMGYTRQSVAIGLAMRGLVALGGERSNVKFVFWVLLAATFHKSAVLLVPIAALAENRGRLWTTFWVGSASVFAYLTLLDSSVNTLVSGYLDSGYDSSGAAIRVTMNALPAFVLIFSRRRFHFRPQERALWLILAALGLALIPALLLSPSSTAVDRIGLYLIPLQLMVLSRIPDAFAPSEQASRFLAVLIVAYSAVIQFVWLNYADNAFYWLPYDLYPFLT
jgi:hypothetical protein